MKALAQSLRFFIVSLVACTKIYAEDGILVVHVAGPKGKLVEGVVLSALGDSSTGPPNNDVRIKLALEYPNTAAVLT